VERISDFSLYLFHYLERTTAVTITDIGVRLPLKLDAVDGGAGWLYLSVLKENKHRTSSSSSSPNAERRTRAEGWSM
jgi:hypothetical protein